MLNDDYSKLVKAILDNALVDYTKLQHKKNRSKKSLHQTFLDCVEMFFDPNFKFEFLLKENSEENLSFIELMEIFLNTNKIDLNLVHENISEQSISYWWEKNFHDLAIPDVVTIAGIVWRIKNSTSKEYIDYEEKIFYLPTNKKGSDRIYISFCLQILLSEASIEIPEQELNIFLKLFYLFLKINVPFGDKK